MKYIKLLENFEEYDPYELMITPPNKKAEMIISEIMKKDKANLNLVRDLILLGANVDWQDNYGLATLHWCAKWNHSRIAKILIDAGADVNIQDIYDSTALHCCAYWNSTEIARMLLDAGADMSILNNFGSTVLHYGARDNRPEIAKMLLDAGADKTIQDTDGILPYELAESKELKELLTP